MLDSVINQNTVRKCDTNLSRPHSALDFAAHDTQLGRIKAISQIRCELNTKGIAQRYS